MKVGIVLLALALLAKAADHDGDGSEDSDERDYTCQEYKDEMQKCMSTEMDNPNEDYYRMLNPFGVDQANFDSFCESTLRLRECAHELLEAAGEDRVEDGCTYMEDTSMLLHATAYSCGDGKDGLLAKYDCLYEHVSVEKSQVVEECMSEALARFHGHSPEGDSDEDGGGDYDHDHDIEEGIKGAGKCDYQALIADCVAAAATKECGSEAGRFITGLKQYLKPRVYVAWDCNAGSRVYVSGLCWALAAVILGYFY